MVSVIPADAKDQSVIWYSSNTSVATVSSSGVVTANAVGTAIITVETSDGNKTATCSITVTPPKPKITGFDCQIIQNQLLVEITVENMADNSTLYFSAYSPKNKLITIQKPVLTNNTATFLLPADNISSAKAFIWDNNLLPENSHMKKQ